MLQDVQVEGYDESKKDIKGKEPSSKGGHFWKETEKQRSEQCIN